MNEHVVRVLEFDKILERLAQRTSFSASRQLAVSLRPSPELSTVKSRLALTTEGRWLADDRPDMRVAGASDVRPLVERAALGAILEPSDLLDIDSTIVGASRLRSGLPKTFAATPMLSERAGALPALDRLGQEITRCLNDRGELRDSASSLIGRLRADIRVAHRRVLDHLDQVMRSGIRAGFVQDPIITQRSGRYVLSVKAEHRRHVRGVVHDQSASGATVYVEPLATVEMSNSLRQLQIQEQHEIRRIMNELSKQVAADGPAIIKTVELLAEIDLALAAGRLSAEQRASKPHLSNQADGRTIQLHGARHPLLGKSVVPINVEMDQAHRVVVITGPNTGGKTVALKTLGLLTLMAQSGLHIPADPGGRLVVFGHLFADIGDEQSIEQSLSTFSSHMTHVIEALDLADDNTLILLDEIGAGTDPEEGSALARATIVHLLAKGSWVVATTHFSELKVFAHETPAVINAAVEFDPGTLSPTYNLVMGLPGQSNALEIASRLGLDTSILADARAMLDGGRLSLEGLLQTTRSELESASKLRHEATSGQQEVERMRRELTERLAQIETERAQVVEATRQQALEELDEVRREIKDLGERVRDDQERIAPAVATRKVRELTKQLAARAQPSVEVDQHPSRENKVGDHVVVQHLQQSGVVTSINHDGTEAEVQLDRVRLRAPTSQLERAARAPATSYGRPRTSAISFIPASPRPPAPAEIDLRGYRAEDIRPALERHLNDAFMDGMPSLRIIHGKGAGTLRRVVREHLGEHPIVKSAFSAPQRDGGEGVTVIELEL